MSFAERETFITVPAELVDYNKGFGMDIGSSGAKFVYLTKEDKENDETSDRTTAPIKKLRTITFARNELTEGLQFVKQRALAFDGKPHEGEPSTLVVTGIGCAQLEQTMMEILNVKFNVVTEMDGVATTFSYLASKLPRRYFIEPHDEQAVNGAMKYCATLVEMMASANSSGQSQAATHFENSQQIIAMLHQNTGYALGAGGDSDDVPLLESEPGLYPCILVGSGSFIYSIKFTAADKFTFGDSSTSGGRMLLGAANKLIGCKTYEEFLNLASTGDSFRVHESASDAFYSEKSGDKDSLYKTVEETFTGTKVELYSFGKLVGANNCADFKDEDIASAWLDHFVQDYVRTVQLFAHASGIKRVFLCGGILAHPHVRRAVAEEMIRRNLINLMTWQAQPVVFDFIKCSQHLTALCCFVFDRKAQAEAAAAAAQQERVTSDETA